MGKVMGNIQGRPLLILITAAASSGFLLFGYDNAVFSGIIVLPWFLETFHHPDSALLGTVSSLYNVGCAIGAIYAFLFGAQLGRRKTILSGASIATVGVIIMCTAEKIPQLLVGRIVTGAAVGVLTSTVGLWQAETTPARVRGRFMCLALLLGGMGLVTAFYTNYGLRNNTTRTAFVLPLALKLVFIISVGILVTFLPESPHWLFKNDRQDEALHVIMRLQGHNATRDDPQVQLHMQEIAEASQLEGEKGGFFSGIFVNGPTQNFKRICSGSGIMLMHRLNGINSVTYYVPDTELMPLHIREKGMGIAVFTYWIFQFMIVEITPIVLKNIGYRFYIILAGFNAVIGAVLFLFYLKTKRKSLEEIDFFFAKRDSFAKKDMNLTIEARGIEPEEKSHGDVATQVENTEHELRTINIEQRA
ncbi:hypothetical protein LTR96_011165 [Exophiala xenobiotica]|nr:hypothetical protein LTR72_011536 [Exophiala xenobiotica]KAK5263427.1 hypothetical protein LTR96_011165 [Exophiala xenobiotica]KAK5285126.1 hypothetical protein LTR14_011214 [Exophiala xenobiotica]KAK5332557.1 hypothetical protein LTR98_011318 [Exophiala xenobiotica]KAK5468963.1 hypothetical protein LTR55_011506 [Exophiala xenobiotica]